MHACTAGQRAHALASRLTPAALPARAGFQTAIIKTHTDWAKTMLRAIGCNWMVCMAVWLSFCATDVFSKCFVRAPRRHALLCAHAQR
jgi:formate/nitrite transporter FocA (FNT family)